MATIEEIRKQYPQYQDLSDKQIADSLYNKYYSDIPQQEFYNKIGYTSQPEPPQPESTGFSGVVSDIASGAMQAPGLLYQGLKALPGEVYGAGKQVFSDPLRAGSNVLAGTAELGQGILNAPSTAARYLSRKELIPEGVAEAIPRKSDFDFAKGLGIQGNEPGDLLLRAASETPMWMLPGGAATQAAKFVGLGAIKDINPATLATSEILSRGATNLIGKVPQAARTTSEFFKQASKELPAAAQEIESIAKQSNIPTMASDLAPESGLASQLMNVAEKSPISKIGTVRFAQKQGAKAAAEALVTDLEKNMITTELGGAGGIDKLSKIAESGGKRAGAAQEIINQFKNAGDDWNKIIKTSGNTQALLNKYKSDKLYEYVNELAEQSGQRVIPDKILNTINNELDALRKSKSINQPEISFIEKIKNDFVQDSLPVNKSFNEIRDYKSYVNNAISDYYSGKNALVGKSGAQSLQKISEAIESDLQEFANTSTVPGIKEAWKNADKYYKENVIPYKDSSLAKALKAESNPDEIYKAFIKSGGEVGDFGTGRAQKFYKALDDKGRAAVRYGMVKQALNEASGSSFSPAKYASSLEKLAASRDVFFKGAEKQRINGLAKVMRHIEKAGLAKPPSTGVQAVPWIVGAIAAFKPRTILPALAASKALDWLLTSDKGKKLLINANSFKPKSNAFDKFYKNNISKQLGQYINQLGAQEQKEED